MVCIGADRKDRRCSRVGRMASSAWIGGTIYRVRGPLTQLEERCPRPQSGAVPRPPCLLLLKGHLLRSPQTPMFSETYKGQSGTGTTGTKAPFESCRNCRVVGFSLSPQPFPIWSVGYCSGSGPSESARTSELLFALRPSSLKEHERPVVVVVDRTSNILHFQHPADRRACLGQANWH